MRYNGDLQPLIDWVHKEYSTEATARRRHDEPPFMDFVRETLPASQYHFWAGYNTAQTPCSGIWLHGFPHVHHWDKGTITMICYLTECEGGNIAIGQDKEMEGATEQSPEPGKCVFVQADEWHGVKKIEAGERLTVIVTAFK